MISVTDNENIIVIKNSKFICIIRHINNISDIDNIFSEVRNKYENATHYCYAYILDNVSKCSDDGEPSGTAGIPILDVLKKNNLNNVLCIVVRYFGKILLGASGLVRAYSKSVTLCLKDHIVTLSKGYNITISFDYNLLKNIDYIIKDSIVLSKNFDKKITYNLNVSLEVFEKLSKLSNCDLTLNNDIYL